MLTDRDLLAILIQELKAAGLELTPDQHMTIVKAMRRVRDASTNPN